MEEDAFPEWSISTCKHWRKVDVLEVLKGGDNSIFHSFIFFYSEKQSTAVLSEAGFELPESTNATQASRVAAVLNVYHCSKHLKSFEDIYLAKDGHKISAYDGWISIPKHSVKWLRRGAHGKQPGKVKWSPFLVDCLQPVPHAPEEFIPWC